jgi:SAM-dependent methyltransferase
VSLANQHEIGGATDEADQAPERFDPKRMHGSLLEAEHLARYWWATRFVSGKRVLDAGCGTGYGSKILARGGGEVVGVDIDSTALDAARDSGGESVTFEVADARALPFADGEFDVAVCFEVIEHVKDPESILDELRRVIRPDGLLVASSPNRDVYPPGNPHHKHEFLPDELAEALGSRFAHVRLVRQHDWLGSGVLEDSVFASEGEPFESVVRKAIRKAPGEELYTLALASEAELPLADPHLVLTSLADAKWWQEELAELKAERDATEEQRAFLARAHEELTRRLVAERVERVELDVQLTQARAEKAELDTVIRSMQSTRVWRLGAQYWKLRDRLLGRR